MITTYEVTYILVCGDDGLISHTIKKIKEIVPETQEQEEEDDNDD